LKNKKYKNTRNNNGKEKTNVHAKLQISSYKRKFAIRRFQLDDHSKELHFCEVILI